MSGENQGPDLFYAGGECLTRFGVWVRRTDMDLEAATREIFTRNSDAEAIGRDGILRAWSSDRPRAEWLSERDIPAFYNSWRYGDTYTGDTNATLIRSGIVAGFDSTDVISDSTSTQSRGNFDGEIPKLSQDLRISFLVRQGGVVPGTTDTDFAYLHVENPGGTFENSQVFVRTDRAEFGVIGNENLGTFVLVSAARQGGEWFRYVVDFTLTSTIPDGLRISFGPCDLDGNPNSAINRTAQFSGYQIEVGQTGEPARPYQEPATEDRKFPTLLLEDEKENIFTFSEELENAAWTKTDASINPNVTTAPDGNATADKLVEDAVAVTTHFLRRSIGAGVPTDNTFQAFSMFAKAAERAEVRVRLLGQDGVFRTAFYNLVTGTIGTATASDTRASIVALPDGWFRLRLEATSAAGGTTVRVEIQLSEGNEVVTYQGDGVSGLFMWGLQFEVDGLVVSSYIPAGGVAATRAGDELRAPYPHPPVPMTVYSKFIEGGTSLTDNKGVFHIGTGAAGIDPRMHVRTDSGTYRLLYDQGPLSSRTSTLDEAPAIGDLVELLSVLYDDASVQVFQALNGAAATAAPRSASSAFPPAWSDPLFFVGTRGESDKGLARVLVHKAQRGVRSLAFMRAL